jgi:DNA-binding XRE family transcriptional regulator
MSDFQDYLDEALANLETTGIKEEPAGPDYDIYAEISEQIYMMCTFANVTQKELAKACGLTEKTINNIERGISKPTIDSLKKIADAFGKRLRIDFDDPEDIY